MEGDEVFTRIRSLLENLLENAQQALEHKSKATGRVLSYYDNGNVEFCTAIRCDGNSSLTPIFSI